MALTPAPFYADVAGGPVGMAYWCRTSDGVRIRLGVWQGPADGTGRGTVLLFPGRCEYVEKYGGLAGQLAGLGYATITVDWRGQGLADRLLADPNIGHVHRFADYQKDVAAMLAAAAALELPRPYVLLSHSMGGIIGLRALLDGLPVTAAAFSAPMWGISIKPAMRPVAWAVTTAARALGLAGRYAPGTGPVTYMATAAFENNVLTSDPGMFADMKDQITAHPDLCLGGPSMLWLNEALREMRRLRAAALPVLPVLIGLGSNERVVDPEDVRAVAARWPSARLELFDGAEHEIIMETDAIRARFLASAAATFAA